MSKTPNLFWDPLYSKFSFNYNSKYTNLKNIYRSSDDLIKDLEKFLNNNKRPNYTIKNIKLYNYYNDSLSNKRVGQYINDYLAEIKNYKSKKESIEIANLKYKKKWGPNTIIDYKKTNFNKMFVKLHNLEIKYVKSYMKKLWKQILLSLFF